ncbi:anti-sigma B factor antagonist [Nonomuraea maritima]|uniref:Anti-sigma factor antagonist n=1 Tax=Nonomuraea maritima TaxID=683260 RepID=A0A1G8WPK9_9ACTN|nr:STAS domain-containing protein [Nonomuraea maritima]SDJ80033.1 anti-sigma B factor antagonist [Nonomuraea maritima]
MPPLSLAHHYLPGVTVITVCGEVDATNRAQFESYLREARRDPSDAVVFDLARMPFLDSSGLHVLLMTATDCLRHGGTVHLAAAQRLPARLFQVTGVAAHIPVYDTVEDAVAAARPPFKRSL